MSHIGTEPAHTFEGARLLAVVFGPDGDPNEIFADGSYYDADRSRSQGLLYALAGFGYIPPCLSRPVKRFPRWSIWIAPGVDVTDGSVRRRKVLAPVDIAKMGYDILPDLPVDRLSDMQRVDHILWCDVCNDHIDADNFCEHLSYCEKCGDYVYASAPRGFKPPGDIPRCRHTAAQRAGEP